LPSRGFKKCPEKGCRNGWVEEFEISARSRLRRSGQHKCPRCHGGGQIPDPKFIASLRAHADDLDRKAQKLLGQALGMRKEADELERKL